MGVGTANFQASSWHRHCPLYTLLPPCAVGEKIEMITVLLAPAWPLDFRPACHGEEHSSGASFHGQGWAQGEAWFCPGMSLVLFMHQQKGSQEQAHSGNWLKAEELLTWGSDPAERPCER